MNVNPQKIDLFCPFCNLYVEAKVVDFHICGVRAVWKTMPTQPDKSQNPMRRTRSNSRGRCSTTLLNYQSVYRRPASIELHDP